MIAKVILVDGFIFPSLIDVQLFYIQTPPIVEIAPSGHFANLLASEAQQQHYDSPEYQSFCSFVGIVK